MRRIPIAIVLVLAALSLGAPTAALARHHHHHVHASGHHGHRRHAHARIERFAPAGPSTPASAPSGDAGTVVSFEGGLLTIELTNKSTVQGAVSEATEIDCEPPEASERTEMTERSGDDQGEDEGGDGHDWHGEGFEGGSPGAPHSDTARAAWSHGGEGADESGAPATCGPSALVRGRGVRFAELRLAPSGSTFEKVRLAP